MFLEYQNEIIALIAIITLLIIFFLVKMKKQESDTLTETTSEVELQQEDIDDFDMIDDYEDFEEELTKELDGDEEGDFGVYETQMQTEPKRKSDIKTRDVPKHAKITKQNFKEFAGTKILVAEDNLINQKVISGLLADSGIELTMANDGQEVLDILEKDSDFLMILMDAHMPRIDGFEATRRVRENPYYDHIVVVALSGDTAADDIKKMSEAGMAEHLEKPLRMDSLYDVLYAYSGTNEEIESADSDYIEVPMTKELNGDKGLIICGGDESFYLEILHEFVNTYEDSAHRLRTLLTSSQEKVADKLLLDIIGVSANIGAEPINKIANSLKEALEDTQEQTYFTILEQYQTHLERLIKDIQEFEKR
jgi:CheY-like chemotaxis protein